MAGGLWGLWPKYGRNPSTQQMTDSFRGVEAVLRRYTFNLCRQFGARQDGTVRINSLDRISECNFLVVVTGMKEAACGRRERERKRR